MVRLQCNPAFCPQHHTVRCRDGLLFREAGVIVATSESCLYSSVSDQRQGNPWMVEGIELKDCGAGGTSSGNTWQPKFGMASVYICWYIVVYFDEYEGSPTHTPAFVGGAMLSCDVLDARRSSLYLPARAAEGQSIGFVIKIP